MSGMIATFAVALTCIYFLWLDRDRNSLSKAAWISLAWICIACSRPVSNWIRFGAPVDQASQYIEGSPIDRTVLLVLFALACVVLAVRSRKLTPLLRRDWVIVLFFAYCAVSILWSDYPFVSFKRWIRAISDLAMVWVLLTETHASEAFQRVVTWMGVVLIPLSILFTRFFPSLGRSYSYGGVPMWTGVATDKNALGALCMIAGVVLLSRFLTAWASPRSGARRRRLLICGVVLLLATYLLLTIDSKTALACFLMGAVLVLMRLVPALARSGVMVSAVALAMFIVSYAVLFLGIGSSALTSMGRNASLTGRTEVWEIVLPYAVDPLFGAGFEGFWIGERLDRIAAELGAGLNQAHNGYVELYLNIGWVGLALLGFVIISGYANIIRYAHRDPDTTALRMAFFLICLVYNFTEGAFKIMSPVWICFLWAITAPPSAAALRSRPGRSSRQREPEPGSVRDEVTAFSHRQPQVP